jgi:activator of HSP90 ATPase
MNTRDLLYTLSFATDATDLYNCFTDPRLHSSFTGEQAIVEASEASSFSLLDGYATGIIMTLERSRKIVLKWKAAEHGWPEDHYSEVTILFKNNENGCALDLFHNRIPASCADNVDQKWNTFYWEPLKIFLER